MQKVVLLVVLSQISCINRKIYPSRNNITFDGKIKKENIMMIKKNMGQI